MCINVNSTYRDILNIPEFIELREYLFHMSEEQILSTIPDNRLSENIPDAWNPEDMVKGFRRIQELKKNGVRVLHHIYPKGELKAEPEKKQTGLLYFPAGTSGQDGRFAVICAGGAYVAVASNVEAFPLAARLNEMGITAFVLKYRTSVECSAKKAEEDLHAAVKYIFAHKELFRVKDDYAVFGFSSGGHLVAEYGTANCGYKNAGLPKPSMLGLAYPALNLEYQSELMDVVVNTMLKKGWTKDDREVFNVFHHIDQTYPKTFFWQTKEDESVPYELNFMILQDCLEKNNILHIAKSVEHGGHGLGLGSGSEAEGWLDEAVEFWENGR